MAGSVNKAILIGNLGNDPEVRSMQSGGEVASFNIATSESWKDKTTGEKQERTQWHKIVIYNEGLVKVAKNYLKKGSKVFIEGQLETRSYDQNGETKYITEVVLRPFRGELTMLESKRDGSPDHRDEQYNRGAGSSSPRNTTQQSPQQHDELEDEIPF